MSRTFAGRAAAAAAALVIVGFAAAPAVGAPAPTPLAPVSDPAAPARASSVAYQAWLTPVPANGATGQGTAWITLTDTTAVVTVEVSGLLDAPHAQHLHIDGMSRCPTVEDASKHSGHRSMSVGEAMKDSGGIGVSLTTKGDTGGSSALAIDRFPTGRDYRYTRTIPMPKGLLTALQKGTVVLLVHGVDHNGNGRYDDAGSGVSELAPGLPAEATDPALCGAFDTMQLSAVPRGAAQAGGGPADVAGGRYLPAAGAGAGGVALLAVALLLRRRRSQV